MKAFRLGFHVSISGSFGSAARFAAAERYGAFQLFVSNPRGWAVKSAAAQDAAAFGKLVRDADIIPFAHIPYLCNPSSPRPEILEKSTAMMLSSMENCSALGIKYLVVHVGSHLGKGEQVALSNLEKSIGSILDSSRGVEVLLENSSGYTNSFGSSMEELGRIMDRLGRSRIGVCLDTCHAFAYGYELSTVEGALSLMDSIDGNIGSKAVRLVHFNDSKFPLGSKKDRHEHIGKGYIGMGGFANFFSCDKLETECYVMETPQYGPDDSYDDMAAAAAVIKAGSAKAHQKIGKNK